MATILFDGIAYGMLLFLISVGLSVTLGMMGFINLAHGVFAMAGGYLLVTLMARAGIGFFAALPLIFLACAAGSVVLERALYRPLYRSTHLKQVLLTVGIILVAVAVATYAFGPAQQPVRMPPALAGQAMVLGLELSRYKLFLVGVGIAVTLVLVFGLERTRFGARIRASVDRQATAEAMGIHVGRVSSSRWPSAAAWRGWAGRWASTSSGSTRNFR